MTRTWIAQRLFIPLFGVILLALLWLTILAQDRRAEALNTATFLLELTNYSRLLESHTHSIIRGLDQVVTHMKAEYEDNPTGFDLKAMVARSPILAGLSVQVGIIGSDGFLMVSTAPISGRVHLGDREHFAIHQGQDDGRLFVSKPVLGRASGKWSIQLTRRLNQPDGTFAGVMVVSLSPDYITDIYRQIDLGRDAAIVVVGRDGVQRARAAGDDRTPGQSIADTPYFAKLWDQREGIVEGAIASDGVAHIGAFRQMVDFPLAVIVSRPQITMAEVHANEHALFLATGIGGSVLLLAGSALLMMLALRQQSTEANLRQRERELIAARNDLERRNRDMEQFTEVLAHHLQEPVRLQMAFAARLQKMLDLSGNTEASKALGHVVNGATRLRALLRDVQLYLAVGMLPPAHSPADCEMALNSSLVRLNQVLAAAGAEVRRTPLPPAIIDQNRLVDIFCALVENAATHHHPDQAPLIEVSARQEDGMAIFSVSDSGPGIPEEFRERVFRVFERLNPENGKAGTGIGLPLVKKIVEAAGGRVWIESSASGGACVRFALPVRSE
ncbi:putative Signal transduction histidine kinase [Magnetospirillum sp. LM-5]|uniref:sensor histidine kinase n=1 Tax=Magnetospirillum sp. LM-5 TaxID=2681466 RepID=UPI00137F90DA|nr:sensor histidine kinase [Magnetospirillum sp. LM-5]CAA7613800.1 putative Signal transduction histidine kinase [Magnetospirillum sp. LM-5]